VVATNGVRHLVFQGNYKRYYPGSGWTPDLANKVGIRPSIALDADGTTIHVVWLGSVKVPTGRGKKTTSTDHVFYQKCVPGSSGNGGWVGTPRDITPNGYTPCGTPTVACYRDGNNVDHIAVTWMVWYTDTLGFCESVGGTWGSPLYLVDPSDWPWDPSVTVDPQDRYGDVFISYARDPGLVYVFRRHLGVWQAPECATAGFSDAAPWPCIEVDPSTGYPHIVSDRTAEDHIYHTYWDPLGGWQPLEMISNPSAPRGRVANMCFSGSSAFVVWAESSSASDRGVRYTVGNYGNWSTPAWVSSGYSDDYPSVTARSNGDVYVVWKDGRNGQIWGRLYTPGSGGGQAQPTALSQSGIELFPNPAKAGRVTVRYSLPSAEPVRVTLLDVSGRAVRTQEIPATDRSGSFSIDVSGLNAGVYVARLVARDLSVSKSLVVGR
jgi:hypothetical protein